MGAYLSTARTEKESTDGENGDFKFGSSAMQGWRTGMEDAHAAVLDLDKDTSFFAVYDGHGGREVARYCSRHLHVELLKTAAYKEGHLGQALIAAYLRMDEMMVLDAGRLELRALAAGMPKGNGAGSSAEAQQAEGGGRGQLVIYTGEAEEGKSTGPAEGGSSKGSEARGGNGNGEVKVEEEKRERGEEGAPEAGGPADESTVAKTKGAKRERDASETAGPSSGSKEDGKPKPDSAVEPADPRKAGNAAAAGGKEAAEGGEEAAKAEAGRKATASGKAPKDTSNGKRKEKDEALMEVVEDDNEEEEVDMEEKNDEENEDEDEREGQAGGHEEDSEDADYVVEAEEDEEDFWTPEEGQSEKDSGGYRGPTAGCTAVAALVQGDVLVVANAGDSRCVISRNGQAVELSTDHKPELEEERERIFHAGGFVSDGRINGCLNLSRAIGDMEYKQNAQLEPAGQMVTAYPELRTTKLQPGDEFLVLACDGIWDVMTSQEVVDFVRARLQQQPGKAVSAICEEMFDHCVAPNRHGNGLGMDNMSAVIVLLKKHMPSRLYSESKADASGGSGG